MIAWYCELPEAADIPDTITEIGDEVALPCTLLGRGQALGPAATGISSQCPGKDTCIASEMLWIPLSRSSNHSALHQ